MSLQQFLVKEKRKSKKKEEILKAATEVFAKKGFLATSIEDIAKHAEIAVGSVYNFFQNKDDLYIQVVESIFFNFLKLLEKRVLSQTEIAGVIREIISLRLGLFFEYQNFFSGVFEAISEGLFKRQKDSKESFLKLKNLYFQKIMQFFQNFQKQLQQFDLTYFVLTLEGTINSCIHYWAHQPVKKDSFQIIEEVTGHFLKLINYEKQMAKHA